MSYNSITLPYLIDFLSVHYIIKIYTHTYKQFFYSFGISNGDLLNE